MGGANVSRHTKKLVKNLAARISFLRFAASRPRGGRKVRVLLVDRCPATRLGVRVSLQEALDIEVLGETANAEEALHLSDELRPDLVILDIELADELEGIRLCKLLKSSSINRPQLLVFTVRNSRKDVAAASLLGADSYLYKGVACARIRETVNMIRGGDTESG
jgi:DNA-binding NarL/FixJ family response regulator